MSYILDALKKSADERRRVQQSDPLLGQPPVYSTADRQVSQGLLPVLAALLLCLSLATGAGWYWLGARPLPDGESPADTVIRNRTENGQAASVGRQATALPATTTAQTTRTQEVSAEPPGRPAPPEAPTNVPLLVDLSPAMQAAIPEIRFSGHVFSPVPSLRMIMANQTIVREQDLLAPDVRLEEITETGVLLSYRGTRFRVELLPPL
ncbi:general secretion pathway protein GspB [Desulfofustis glycolicus]|uniref:Type II secretion system protein B n=1 Tax=Desulfofustis glycolicus DSM 9705 TaxID=1121409 RepID=A0A1M5XZX8_9BACT|nr:general secretion pathway protein GspB [Desulfofustis glycolicus]MCB2218265.1 general secretion pathway protein GspB [Desulfobulbaceae bacterium]SHI05108.1 Type II secretion system protein B [Desulfofustis glycolicus DSM 9705]